ncbi:hypothetical protein [Clostridium lacusfryxellense]|uniref:hypothetical protein n=1 Tax=Clostridium lacusfryxellense TaxID=205328 RepID=UPI001C0C1A2F|nr:hypothetical protein [Clostridium lacusfryxellense]MBU3112472.1 hypothetical protein [Clostridium lacusfryxellense]
MRKVYSILSSLHLFVGIGAMFGGLAAIISPQSPMGMSVDVLKNSPFSNYLMPGVILFTIIGLGNIVSALTFRFKLGFQGYISCVFSWALVIFIVVQCLMINDVVFLHILFFIIGLIQASLSIIILFEKRLFPTNLALSFYKKLKL